MDCNPYSALSAFLPLTARLSFSTFRVSALLNVASLVPRETPFFLRYELLSSPKLTD